MREVFDEKVIGIGWDPEWTPRLPELNSCDYYLWGRVQNMIFEERSASLTELRVRIETDFGKIDIVEISDACSSKVERLKTSRELMKRTSNIKEVINVNVM